MISVLQLSSQSVVEIIMLRGDPGRSVKGAPRAGVASKTLTLKYHTMRGTFGGNSDRNDVMNMTKDFKQFIAIHSALVRI